MPFEIVCYNCNTSLYSTDLKHASRILKLSNGKCKKCGDYLALRDFVEAMDKN